MNKRNITATLNTGTLRAVGEPASAHHQTPELRALRAIEIFETELLETSSGVERFLLHYFCCDVLAYLIQGRWNNLGQAESLSPGKNQPLKISQVTAALNRVGGEWKMPELDLIFHSKEPRDSARILRNKIVHQLDETAISAAHSKIGVQRIESMRRFIDATKRFIDAGGEFVRK